LVVVLLLLALRLVQVQVFGAPHYRSLANKELTEVVALPALRGGLYDRQGHVLAMSVPTEDVYADDYQVSHPVAEAAALAPFLGVPAATLATELHRPSGYVALAKEVPRGRAERLGALALPGISLLPDAQRSWPDGALAAPVIGGDHASGAGASGLEAQYQTQLAGRPGHETFLQTPLGVALPQSPVAGRSPSVPGTGLELTLDQSLQYDTEQALGAEIVASKAVSGTAVIMDTRTGNILAMANLAAAPAGSPAAPAGSVPPPGVAEAPSNLALTQLYEPGSVFKLVTFSAALQDGVINPTSQFSVPGQITLDGSVFHDAEAHGTEELSATQILAQSSNIGTSEIAQGLGEPRLLAQVKDLGFGQPTGLGFPGEDPGLLVGASQWEPTDMVSLPIGQVDAVSAQQVLDAYNSVANGGEFVAPRLVQARIGSDGSVRSTPPSAGHRVMTPTVAGQLTGMLEQVVAQGTGTSAVVPGYTVAGKTGTAQIPDQGQAGYVPGAYMASFVGFAPADHPVFSAIVVLNRPTPYFGGTVAAPVFAQIMGDALHRFNIPTSAGAPTSATPAGGASVTAQAQDIT
jgi:cell division protein FtsI (penicillin-binding protein 3)